ncbi:GNAT family N-acetyltransferase [Flaviramulus sp. BrNp1-15]|uniref:GNAT family N-acetyltransferase n=1 Tax=Flaviramulus sp. BrNp1-15 TaxID=2916754 RepID=UPI001EE98D33|nr:GNAT family N-acetyltransferase [Flaviramulus sp. BrNp1-15]ULC58540.1 GNAT family N-acetyltransferase [Flaviramulus sp. BrNp1-15]
MKINEVELDNPVWNALTDTHIKECIDYGNVKFYHPHFAPFGAFINDSDTSNAIKEYSKLTKDFFIVGNKPKMPKDFKAAVRYVGYQMIIYEPLQIPINQEIVKLNKSHYEQLIDLVKLVYPHFFKAKTNELGTYYGIFKNGKLIAVTGERFQSKNFIEISAVITHPDHVGKGYAKQLITHTSNEIFKKNKTPYLHVDVNNLGPIALYKKLGFKIRREMEYWRISC